MLKTKEIKMLNVNQNWPDWSVKHAWPLIKDDERVLIKNEERMQPYLQKDELSIGIYPGQNFF